MGRIYLLSERLDSRKSQLRVMGDRPFYSRLVNRTKQKTVKVRTEPSAQTLARSVRVRNIRHTPEPEPNAPLLKRVIRQHLSFRDPMQYSHRRNTVTKRFRLSEVGRVRTENPMRTTRERFGRVLLGNPLRAVALGRPEPRETPSVEEWLSNRGVR